MLYITRKEFNKFLKRLRKELPKGICYNYETRSVEGDPRLELVTVRLGQIDKNQPNDQPNDELLGLKCEFKNVAINMLDMSMDGEIWYNNESFDASIESMKDLMIIIRKMIRFLDVIERV